MNEESLSESSLDKSQNGSSSRAPKCRRCRNHNVLSDLRGHKHQCKFKDCVCSKCVIVTDGQRQTAVRIALYRQQRNCENEMKHNSQSFENGVEGNGVWNGNIEEKSLENGKSAFFSALTFLHVQEKTSKLIQWHFDYYFNSYY